MAYQDDLLTARANCAARLVEITSKPKPDYSIDGESYSWAGYFQALTNQLEILDHAIQRADGAWEVNSKAIT